MILNTGRLTLRPISMDDLGHMVRTIMSDRDVMAWLPYAHATATPEGQQAVARGYLEDFTSPWEELGYGIWAVFPGSMEAGVSDHFMGYCGFIKGQLDGEGPEIAYALGKAYWGRGVIPEALGTCLEWLFRHIPVPSVYAVTDRSNKASQRVMEKTGLRYEKEVNLYSGMLPCFILDRKTFLTRSAPADRASFLCRPLKP